MCKPPGTLAAASFFIKSVKKRRLLYYGSPMTMQLPPDVQAWIDQQVKVSAFRTPAEAITFAVRHVMARDDDLSWIKPLLDEPRTQIARGEGVSLADFRARMQARKDALPD
jgi:Arc/MetJ-type ribon-helix-helix transcriptional regulator